MLDRTVTEASENVTSDISIFDLITLFSRHKKIIIGTVLTGTLGVGAVSLLVPNTYTAKATIIPIEKNSSNNISGLLGSLDGGLGMLASQAGLSNQGASARFITLLRSRTVAENVIANHKLLPVLFPERWDNANQTWKKSWFAKEPTAQGGVEKLRKIAIIEKDNKSELISIKVDHHNPATAAMIANAFTEQLDSYLKTNTLSTFKRNRVFIESQLEKTKSEMEEHELALKNFQQSNKLISLDTQAQAAIKTYSEIKSRLMAAEIELNILEKSSFEGDPRVTLKKQEIAETMKQLSKLEEGEDKTSFSIQKAPALGLNYARLKRDLLVRERVFELLTQQFEMAKIQEAQEDISFQVLDPAIAPEKKSKPKRALMVLAAFLVSLPTGLMIAFARGFSIYKKESA